MVFFVVHEQLSRIEFNIIITEFLCNNIKWMPFVLKLILDEHEKFEDLWFHLVNCREIVLVEIFVESDFSGIVAIR